jgi:hypothetical protein
MTDQSTAEPEPHEVGACYTNLTLTPEGRPSPALDCSCGFSCEGPTWEQAGAVFDGHMAKVWRGSGDRGP